MARLSRSDLDKIKAEHPLDALVEKHVTLGRASAKGIRAGQCLCTPKKGRTPLWVNAVKGSWGCKYGGCGGDAFSFLDQFEGLDFSAALTALTGGAALSDPAAAERLAAARAQRLAEREARAAALAEEERGKAYSMWRAAGPIEGTLVDAYFAHRGLAPVRSKALRFSKQEAYWIAPEEESAAPQIVHRGPCLFAAIQGPDGRFIGLHRTWLDPRLGTAAMPREASGKAAIIAEDGTPLVAKKMRGGKQGGAIRLHDFRVGGGEKVFLAGEGIETVETAYQAVNRAYHRNYAAWAAGDLGNLSGGGLGPSAPHPSKPLRIPSDEPDPAAPGLMPPREAMRAVLLGDGDSDSLVTGARLRCAKARWVRAGVPTKISMAEAGLDFNDMARPPMSGGDMARGETCL